MEKAIDTLETYLEYVGRCRGSNFGRRFRSQFRDNRGTAELAMLAAPSEAEYEEFHRIVAAMNEDEKRQPERLTDEMINEIARRADADPGNTAIFINGYVLKKNST
jgi:hypothetical protein